MKQTTFLLFTIFVSLKIQSQDFTNINADLINISGGKVEWGDYDNDNDLDFYFIGTDFSLNLRSGLYQNDNGNFRLLNNNLKDINTNNSTAAWGDYDNDSDLDIIIGGTIYSNDSGIFTKIDANIVEVSNSSISWGDYDNDDDLDLIITGSDSDLNYHSIIYRNENNSFVNINANLTGIIKGTATWGDYDNDNDLDLVIIGDKDNNGNIDSPVLLIYENRSNTFHLHSTLTGLISGTAAWGDYDNDDDLDLLVSGSIINNDRSFTNKSILYTNINGIFSDSEIVLAPLSESFADWIDYNEDGLLDIMMTGKNNDSNSETLLYINDRSNIFFKTTHEFINVQQAYFDWGDYNNDGKNDLIITGTDNNGGFTFKTIIYRQNEQPTLGVDNQFISTTENNIYPNPFSNKLNIELKSFSSTTHIDLYNSLGKLILSNSSIDSEKLILNTTKLASGIYFVKTKSFDQIKVTKIFKK